MRRLQTGCALHVIYPGVGADRDGPVVRSNSGGLAMPPKAARRTEEQVSSLVLRRLGGPRGRDQRGRAAAGRAGVPDGGAADLPPDARRASSLSSRWPRLRLRPRNSATTVPSVVRTVTS